MSISIQGVHFGKHTNTHRPTPQATQQHPNDIQPAVTGREQRRIERRARAKERVDARRAQASAPLTPQQIEARFDRAVDKMLALYDRIGDRKQTPAAHASEAKKLRVEKHNQGRADRMNNFSEEFNRLKAVNSKRLVETLVNLRPQGRLYFDAMVKNELPLELGVQRLNYLNRALYGLVARSGILLGENQRTMPVGKAIDRAALAFMAEFHEMKTAEPGQKQRQNKPDLPKAYLQKLPLLLKLMGHDIADRETHPDKRADMVVQKALPEVIPSQVYATLRRGLGVIEHAQYETKVLYA